MGSCRRWLRSAAVDESGVAENRDGLLAAQECKERRRRFGFGRDGARGRIQDLLVGFFREYSEYLHARFGARVAEIDDSERRVAARNVFERSAHILALRQPRCDSV